MRNLINGILFLAVVGIVFTSCENDVGDAIKWLKENSHKFSSYSILQNISIDYLH